MHFPSTILVNAPHYPHISELMKRVDGTIQIKGVDGSLLDILASKLNFSYKFVESDGSWGRLLPGGNWSGVVGLLQHSQVDMGFGFIGLTAERMGVVDFSTSYHTHNTVFAVNTPGPLSGTLAFLKVFQLPLWMSIFCVILLMPSIFKVLLGLKFSYSRLLLEMAGQVLKQGYEIKDESVKGRILVSTWQFFVTIISFGYGAALLSFLTLPIQSAGIRNFRELSEAVQKGKYTCFTVKGSADVDVLLNADEAYLRTLGNIMVQKHWFLDENMNNRFVISPGETVLDYEPLIKWQYGAESVHSENRKYLGTFSDSNMMSEDALVQWNVAIGIRKDFCCKKKVDTIITRLIDAGIVHKLVTEENIKTEISRLSKMVKIYHGAAKITFEDMKGTFALLLLGYLLSFLAFIKERISFEFINRTLEKTSVQRIKNRSVAHLNEKNKTKNNKPIIKKGY